jgi:hypothetical protein
MARKKKKDVEEDYGTSTSTTSTTSHGGESEGIVLKGGNREGLHAIVAVNEDVKVDQDHDANISSVGFNGKLSIENPSTVDRLWDINIVLSNVEGVSLESENITIRELGTEEENNKETQEFQLKGAATNLLLVKEYINTRDDADDILNPNDIETDLLKLKEKAKSVEAQAIREEEEVVEEEEEVVVEEEVEEEGEVRGAKDKENGVKHDGGVDVDEYHLESFGISLNKTNNITFAIALNSFYDKSITDVKIVKDIPSEFTNVNIRSNSVGLANLEGNQIVWTIEELNPESTILMKFTADILVETLDAVKTGLIEVSYKAESSFTGGLGIEKFDAYTRNKFNIDMVERDEEPGFWDCKLVFENPSEFFIELYDIDVHAPDSEGTNFITISEDMLPQLPAGAEWHSDQWEYESEEYPSFRRKLGFRVLSEFQTRVQSTISIEDVALVIASITGTVAYDLEELPSEVEEAERKVYYVPSYKDGDIPTIFTLENNGSAPLDEVKFTQKQFNNEFQPPKSEEIEVLWDGNPIEVDPDDITITDDSIEIDLKDLKNKSTGMFEPRSKIEVKYPIHAVSPPMDDSLETEVIYNANTYPIGQELEFIPETEDLPIIKVIHIRRKYRVGKEIIPTGTIGKYQVLLYYKNLGDMPLKDFTLQDRVPDNFEYGTFSTEPTEITDEVGTDTLKWEIEVLEQGDEIEFTYEISGTGEYRASDAQIAF